MTATAKSEASSLPRRRPGRGALTFLAGLLAVSGAIRLGLGMNEARALVPEAFEAGQSLTSAGCEPPPMELVAALRAREDRILVQEAAVADRNAALALAEQAIAKRLEELRDAEASLSATLSRADGAAEADLAKLTAVYESMKPKDAASLFEAMKPEFAAGFLGRMRPEIAAAIMSGLSSEAAYSVSVLLAGRNALVPKN
ncbi:MAG: hypothetical protein Q7J57_07120 [Gemmobacter sp.]|nr:hypothetical protein [Gemmobacter sp.]